MENKDYYMAELDHYDGECFVTFYLLSIDTERKTVTVALTRQGKISVVDYCLFEDKNGRLYFEYSVTFSKIHIEDFEKNEQLFAL